MGAKRRSRIESARNPEPCEHTRAQLRLADYFALAFGTMVGAGWLVLMDDWLGRSGRSARFWDLLSGEFLLLPVGYVYGQWVQRLPDAGR